MSAFRSLSSLSPLSSLNQTQVRYLAVLAGVLFAGLARPTLQSAGGIAVDSLEDSSYPAQDSSDTSQAPLPMDALHFPNAIPGPARERGRSFLCDFRTEATFYDVCHFYADRLFSDKVPLLPVRSDSPTARDGWRIEPAEKDRVYRAALYRFHEGCRIGVYVTRGLTDSHTHIHLRYDMA
jgi:hypothetical protein